MIRYGPAGACLLVAALWLGVAWRQDTAADRWMARMRLQGEKFTCAEFGLERPASPNPVFEALEVASGRLKALEQTAIPAPFQELDDPQPGARLVSWRQSHLYGATRQVLDWERAGTVADQLQPALAELHAVLRVPPRDPGWSYTNVFRAIPNFVHHRIVAQCLHELIMVEIHRNDLAAAHRDLLTLIRLCRLNEEGWTLVIQMIRTAMLGLTTDAVWNALQAAGWTEDQLREIQQELERTVILSQLPRTFEVERAGSLAQLDRYIREGPSSVAWIWQMPGFQRPPVWLEQASFVFWRAVRSGKDRLLLLQYDQQMIERYRRLASGVPLLELGPPPEVVLGWWNRSQTAQRLFPLSSPPNFVRVAEVATRNDAERLMAITALALERYRLQHGRYPGDLRDLQPDFLAVVPKEAISGQALRYRLQPGPVPMLCAVGFDDPRDQGYVPPPPGRTGILGPRDRRPLIWPAPATAEQAFAAMTGEKPVGEVLPLIQFDGAPLRDVIKTLVRQTDMNLIFDPAVTSVLTQLVSLRLENVTAQNVLEVLLKRHGLRAEENPATRICRITHQ